MSDDIIMINESSESIRSAAQIFKSTVGLTMKDGVLCVVFSTVENRKGYGKQYIPVAELEATLAVLQDARDSGIVNETEQRSTAQIVKDSLIENEDGEIRFKTEDSKGKKPTLLSSQGDFDSFVNVFEQYAPKIVAKAKTVSDKIK